MNKSSYFIPNKALFGSYPSQSAVAELENEGVSLFVNLTEESEGLEQYRLSNDSEMLSFPIPDRKTPTNTLDFSLFCMKIVLRLSNFKNNQKLYVHCKGGHGRAGILVACILCYHYNIEPIRALELTTRYHYERKEMRAKWRSIGSPQTQKQKQFVIKLFEPLRFYKAYKVGNTTGFSNFSAHSVWLERFDKTFDTSEAAFNAFKDPLNKEYIERLVEAKTPFIAKDISKRCNLRSDWYERREEFMTEVIYAKIQQHKDFKQNLINSCLRPIIHHTRKDKFWGDGPEDNGQNILGKILMNIRHKLFKDMIMEASAPSQSTPTISTI